MKAGFTVASATPADAPAIAAIYAPFVTDTAITFETDVPSADAIAQRMHTPPALWLVARDASKVVGYAYAGPHRSRRAYRWSSETSVYLAPEAQGRGLGRALYTTLLVLLPDLGYTVALGGVALPNAASIALHRRCGFSDVGTYRRVGFKLGRFWDVLWMEHDLRAPKGEPDEPRVWTDLSAAERHRRLAACEVGALPRSPNGLSPPPTRMIER